MKLYFFGKAGFALAASTLIFCSPVLAQETGMSNNVVFSDTFQGDFAVGSSSTRIFGATDPQSSNPFNVSISLGDPNATVYAAYADWSYLTDNPSTPGLANITLNGTAVTASSISSGSPDLGWSYNTGAAYLADVTSIVKAAAFTGGNATFSVGNATDKAGSLGEGFSLLVIYRDATMPTKEVDVYSGYTSTASGSGTSIFGLKNAYAGGNVNYFINGLDGQKGYGDTFQINGKDGTTNTDLTGLGTTMDALQGKVGPGGTPGTSDLYDQITGNVSNVMTIGDTSLTTQIYGAGNGTNLTDFVGDSFGAISFAAAPEPSALALAALGGLGLIGAQWWRKRTKAGKYRLFCFFFSLCGLILGFSLEAQTGPVAGAKWQFRGPNNLDVSQLRYFGVRPLSGRVAAIAWSRSNTNIVYAGGGGGGVWKSSDGGATWAVTGSDTSAAWNFVQVNSLAVDPKDENTVYAGSGTWRNVSVDQRHPIGLLKSSDGGATWSNIMPTNQVISKVVVDPDNSQIITFAAYDDQTYLGQVWRSTNGGASWYAAIATQGSWSDLCVSGRDKTGKRYYYAVGYAGTINPLVQVSTNQAAGAALSPWTDISGNPTLNRPANVNNASLAISASQVSPQTVYLLAGDENTIQQSLDAGMTWNNFTAGFPATYDNAASSPWEQSSYDYHIEAAWIPGTSVDVIYVGLVPLYGKCSDNSPGWTDIAQVGQAAPSAHSDQQALAFNPRNPNQILFGNDGGLYRMVFNSDPAVRTWTGITGQPNQTLGLTQFYNAAYDPGNAANMLGGTQDNSTPRSFGAVSAFDAMAASLASWNNCGGGDGGYAAIKSVNPQVAFAEVNGALAGTANGWASRTTLLAKPANTAFAPPIALDGTGASSNTFFYGSGTNVIYYGSEYLYRVNWDETNPPVVDSQLGGVRLTGQKNTANRNRYITAITIAPGDNNRLYTGSSDGAVWMTRHALASNGVPDIHWEQIDDGALPSPNRWVGSIAVDPFNQNRIFVSFRGTSAGGNDHIWRCDDVTQIPRNWVNIDHPNPNGLPDVPVSSIALDPNDPLNTLYIGNDGGVFYSSNGGMNWADATHPLGLPAAQVNDLKAVGGTGILNAATYGRGIWSIPLTNAQTQIAGFGISPNPISSNSLSLAVGRITLSRPAPPGGVTIQIINDHPSTYNFTNQFIAAGQISTFFFVLGLDQQPGANITFTAILGTESRNTVLQVVDPASGRIQAVQATGNTIATSISMVGNTVNVFFPSQLGVKYTLLYKNSLSDPSWKPLPPSVLGTGGVLTLQDTTGTQPQRFYLVAGLPGE